MFIKYAKTLIEKTKHYDKTAQNPFLEFCESNINDSEYNPFKSIYEKTYIWVENKNK